MDVRSITFEKTETWRPILWSLSEWDEDALQYPAPLLEKVSFSMENPSVQKEDSENYRAAKKLVRERGGWIETVGYRGLDSIRYRWRAETGLEAD